MNLKTEDKDRRMSVLGAESYGAVCHLVTDVEALSREERSHVLWYACDEGDLSMVKSVIRAGCDVDHFHRGHTPLMMASIGGHDDVVKELILAGCKVDLRSSKCFVGWFGFITKMASLWPSLALSSVVALLVLLGDWYGLFVLPAALGLVCYDYFKVSRLLRLRSRAQVIAWAGSVPAAVLVLVYIWTATAGEEEEQVVERTVLESLTVLASLLMFALTTVLWIGIAYAQLKRMAEEMSGIVLAVAVAVEVAVAGSVTGIMAWFKARDEGEIVIKTESVGMSVAVAGTLALVLTVTKGGTDDLPYAFGATIAAVLTVTGLWGLTLQETFLEQSLAVIITVILAIWFVALPLIEFTKRLNSVTGMTALYYAAWYDHITCGSHLVEAGANMRAENRYFRTPLHICSHRFRAAVQQAQSHPPQQVIAVIGNTEYGKSTLIAALQSESRTLWQSLVCTLSQVYNITQRTAGIETVSFSSAKYGKVLFYDFAGQSDYHGPHQPFLEAILSKAGVTVTVLLLVKVSEAKDVITQQLRRWLQPLALARTPSTPRVIVVGSYLDQAKSKNLASNVQKLQACIDSVQEEYPSLKVPHVFIEKELPCSVRRHCCSVWVNGLSLGSTTGVDVAIQISDSSVVQVIVRSREEPGELYRYMCSVTQSVFKTIARLSPALKATPYIIHPYTYRGLNESRPSPPATRYPVASVVGSIEAGHKYVHSLPISRGSGSSRVSLQELFGGWSPSLAEVQCLKEVQKGSSELSVKLYATIYHVHHWTRMYMFIKCFSK